MMSPEFLGLKYYMFSFRCFYISQSYAGAKKWKESIGLYAKVISYAQEALSKYKQLAVGSLHQVSTQTYL